MSRFVLKKNVHQKSKQAAFHQGPVLPPSGEGSPLIVAKCFKPSELEWELVSLKWQSCWKAENKTFHLLLVFSTLANQFFLFTALKSFHVSCRFNCFEKFRNDQKIIKLFFHACNRPVRRSHYEFSKDIRRT